MKGIIIFTDIKSSSILWNKHKNVFLKKVIQLNSIIKKFLIRNHGFLLKQIGDSSMIFFEKDQVLQSIIFMIELQKYLEDKKIVMGKDILYIRIGCSLGEMTKYKEEIQNCIMIDYYGENVNIASRMESKISKPGGFAIHNIQYETLKDKLPEKLKLYLDKNYDIKKKKIKNLNYQKSKKRSKKLINSFKSQMNKYKVLNLKSILNFIPKKKCQEIKF